MNEQERLNDHISHILGRITHLEAQVASLALQLAQLQASVAMRTRTFPDGSQLIETRDGTTIIETPTPYNNGR